MITFSFYSDLYFLQHQEGFMSKKGELDYYLFLKYLFIILAVLGLSFGSHNLHWSIKTLSCGLWDLVPRPGIKPGPPILGAQSLSHWTTREVPIFIFIVVQL